MMGDEARTNERASAREAGASVGEFDESGGDPVCWAHLLCEDCGVVLTPGVEHRGGCRAVEGRLSYRVDEG